MSVKEMIPCAYRLPWSRYDNAEAWMRCEIVASKFSDDGKPISWAVREGGCVLHKDDMEFKFEPLPSSRDAEFYRVARFDTAEEAFAAAKRYFTEPSRKAVQS